MRRGAGGPFGVEGGGDAAICGRNDRGSAGRTAATITTAGATAIAEGFTSEVATGGAAFFVAVASARQQSASSRPTVRSSGCPDFRQHFFAGLQQIASKAGAAAEKANDRAARAEPARFTKLAIRAAPSSVK